MRQVRRPKNKDESNLIKKATNEAKKTPAQSFPCKIPAKHEFGLAANGQRADIYSSRRGTDFLSIDWALAMCTIGAKRPRDLFLLLSFRVFLLSSQTRMKRLIVKKKPRSWGLQQEAATPLYLYESKQMGPARKRYNPAPPSLSNLLLLLVGILVIHTQEHGQKTQRAAWIIALMRPLIPRWAACENLPWRLHHQNIHTR